jgi:hypothetical protein
MDLARSMQREDIFPPGYLTRTIPGIHVRTNALVFRSELEPDPERHWIHVAQELIDANDVHDVPELLDVRRQHLGQMGEI